MKITRKDMVFNRRVPAQLVDRINAARAEFGESALPMDHEADVCPLTPATIYLDPRVCYGGAPSRVVARIPALQPQGYIMAIVEEPGAEDLMLFINPNHIVAIEQRRGERDSNIAGTGKLRRLIGDMQDPPNHQGDFQ